MATAPAPPNYDDTLIQYIVVRRDLKNYGTGALIAQGSHAAAAALHVSRDAPTTQAYLADLDAMHTVVLEGGSAEALREAAEGLEKAGVQHKVWVERPEMVVTALASAPNRRALLKPLFAAFKLLR